MFILAKMRDTVKIKPVNTGTEINEVIAEELNRKLANKVLHNVGLCIALHDILEIEKSFISSGDGCYLTKVCFRYVVFRPVMEEILIGKVRSCSREGVQVSLQFFDDIMIPPHKLQQPARFDEAEQVWVWEYAQGAEPTPLFMDPNNYIRFRVINEKFREILPSAPNPTSNREMMESSEENTTIPYSLEGAIDEPGLGITEWWGTDG